MFSGIVRAMGTIAEATVRGDAMRIAIAVADAGFADVAIGDSMAVAGCCLTVAAREGTGSDLALHFDLSPETLARTAGLDRPGRVNLERSLRLSDRLDGHFVAGHVDGVGTVEVFVPAGANDAAAAGNRRLVVRFPAELGRSIAVKGSIAVAGVSLTVNAVKDDRFEVNLIPHTLATTTLGALSEGDRVNLEVDLLARYVERMLGAC